jgi:TPR repeat protein
LSCIDTQDTKTGYRTAASGTPFPKRWFFGTIFRIWGLSEKYQLILYSMRRDGHNTIRMQAMTKLLIFLLAYAVVAMGSLVESFAGPPKHNGAVQEQDKSATTAQQKWRHLAEQGNADAQIMLGWAYHEGVTVGQDYKKAAHWFAKSAEQGNSDAQVNLAMMYDEGLGVKQSYETAFKWYRKAAEQGSENAQLTVGDMYSEGLGVPRDYVQAHMWYAIVGIRGLQRGDEYRAKVEKNMTRAQIAQADKLARAWTRAHQK